MTERQKAILGLLVGLIAGAALATLVWIRELDRNNYPELG